MKFTTERPATQQIMVKGQSNQRPIEFVGLFKTFSKEKLAELKARITEIEGLADGDLVYDAIANEIFIGWENVPGKEEFWVTDNDDNPLECTDKLRAELLSWPSVTFCLVSAFYRAMFSETVSLGNWPRSRGNGFRQRVAGAGPLVT